MFSFFFRGRKDNKKEGIPRFAFFTKKEKNNIKKKRESKVERVFSYPFLCS